MHTSIRATGYDLFKLIVALLLLMLFLLLLWRPGSQPLSAAPTTAPFTPSVTTDANPIAILETQTTPSSTPHPSPLPTETVEPTSTIEPSPTATRSDVSTPTPLSSPTETTTVGATPTTQPSPTATSHSASTPTPLPSPTGTATVEATSTPVQATPSVRTACEAATERSRLQTGRNATLLRRLNFRSSPGIQNNWLRTNIPGTRVEVVGGPECLPHLWGAYVWWQIRLPNGAIGWSAEGSLHGTFYFMEPTE